MSVPILKKGSDIAQCSAIPSFVIIEMPERGGNIALFGGKVAANLPQGDL